MMKIIFHIIKIFWFFFSSQIFLFSFVSSKKTPEHLVKQIGEWLSKIYQNTIPRLDHNRIYYIILYIFYRRCALKKLFLFTRLCFIMPPSVRNLFYGADRQQIIWVFLGLYLKQSKFLLIDNFPEIIRARGRTHFISNSRSEFKTIQLVFSFDP